MKIRVLLLLVFFKITFIYSQNEYLQSADSLYTIINSTNTNIAKIKHYQELCNIYFENDLKKVEKCNAMLHNLATKTNSKQGLGYYYCNKAKLVSYTNTNEAIIFAKKSSKFFINYKDWDNYVYAYAVQLSFLETVNEQETNKVLQIAIQNNSQYLADLYYSLSKIYFKKNDSANRLLYLQKALQCKKPFKKKYQIYNAIADEYFRLTKYDKAIYYNDMALKCSKTSKAVHFSLLLRADIFCDNNQSKDGLPLALICSKYFKKNGYLYQYKYTQFIISFAYYYLKDYQKANDYIDMLLKSPTEDMGYEIDKFTHKVKICLALNDIKTAKEFVDKALQLLDKETSFNMRMRSYQYKVDLEKKLGNYKTALYYQELLLEATNEENKKNYNSKLQELEVSLDLTEKNNQIKNLQIEQLEKKSEIKSKNNYLIYISIALLVAILSVLFYVKSNKNINKKNLIIEKEKLLTKISLAEKETLLKEIHHRVKNNLQLVMSLLNVQAQKENQDVEGFLAVSKSRILSMALIHENLYQSENLNAVNFKEYIHNLTQIILNTYQTERTPISLQIKMDEVYFDIQTAIPLGLIINELVSNAYKYAFPDNRNGMIQIKLIQKKRNSELTISDNGIGIANIENQKKTLGLQLVEELVFQIDGKMEVLNNNGLKYKIRFENPNINI